MNRLRGWLFDNLGLKLVALLLAVLVYLNAYTDRPASMIVTFPVQITDLADSLALTGSAPSAVQAELMGTGKQLIRLRVTEPTLKLSLAGVTMGHFERAVSSEDLPLPPGVQLALDRMVSPRTIELQVDRRVSRHVALGVHIEGDPGGGALQDGAAVLSPTSVRISGPASIVSTLERVELSPIRIAGKRDTVVAHATVIAPEWCTADPATVEVHVPITTAAVRRLMVTLDPPASVTGYRVVPERVALVLMAPRDRAAELETLNPSVRWSPGAPLPDRVGRKVAVRLAASLPFGVSARFEPDSVTLERVGR